MWPASKKAVKLMKITSIETISLNNPRATPIQDATTETPNNFSGRGQLFVRIYTDEGVEGLGMTYSSPGVKDVVETALMLLSLIHN